MSSGTIEVIAETDLTPQDTGQIADLLRNSFPTDFGGRSYYQQRPHLRVIWREDRILSHISLFLRAIRIDDEIVHVMGVGDVATDPKSRGSGYAGQLLSQSFTEGKRCGAEFMVLFGDRNLYDRAGFLPAENQFCFTNMVGARTGEVITKTSVYLRVKPLTDRPWPQAAKIDFLGFLF